MNIKTGEIKPFKEIDMLPVDQQKDYVEIKRDLTLLEENTRQIKMYSPCGCGSGKKFKFCCYKNI